MAVDDEPATVYVLQGDIVLSSIEALTVELVENPPPTTLVVFDMSRVDEVRPVAWRVAAENAAKLADEGHRIVVVDPDGTIEEFADSVGRPIERWSPERLHDALA